MEVKCRHVPRKPEKEVISTKGHMNHQLYRHTLPAHTGFCEGRKALCVILFISSMPQCIYMRKTSVRASLHGAMPDYYRSAILPRCQKEDSPRLDLV